MEKKKTFKVLRNYTKVVAQEIEVEANSYEEAIEEASNYFVDDWRETEVVYTEYSDYDAFQY